MQAFFVFFLLLLLVGYFLFGLAEKGRKTSNFVPIFNGKVDLAVVVVVVVSSLLLFTVNLISLRRIGWGTGTRSELERSLPRPRDPSNLNCNQSFHRNLFGECLIEFEEVEDEMSKEKVLEKA